MIQTTNTNQVLQALPEGKVEEKKARTKTGTVLVLVGLLLTLATFLFGLRIIDRGTEITLVVLGLILLPAGLGVLLCIVGATVWSGELVTAGFKDALGTIGAVTRAVRGRGAEEGTP